MVCSMIIKLDVSSRRYRLHFDELTAKHLYYAWPEVYWQYFQMVP